VSVVSRPEVARLTKSQFSAARKTLERAFLDYPLMVYASSDPLRRARGVSVLYSGILRDTLRYGEVYASQEVGGVACWLPPGVPIPTFFREARSGLLGLPLAFGWSGFRRLVEYGQWHARLHHELAVGPHWFLATIGVDPARQRQGVGGALLNAVLKKADSQQVPCYLETHLLDNVRLYERHGFETVRLFDVPGHTVPVWAMRRKARSI